MLSDLEFLARLGTAFGLGCLIGFERQVRQRSAGLRTTALVCCGACMFVCLSYHFQEKEASPSRIAAGVVAGIGFLGAGVIMRQGATVRGLTTAATLWCAAAIGSLAGAGELLLAFYGSMFVFLANLLLRPVSRVIDKLPAVGKAKGAAGD